jgi:hypothetical protein
MYMSAYSVLKQKNISCEWWGGDGTWHLPVILSCSAASGLCQTRPKLICKSKIFTWLVLLSYQWTQLLDDWKGGWEVWRGKGQSLSKLWRELVHVTSLHCFCIVCFNWCSNFGLLIVVSLMTKVSFSLSFIHMYSGTPIHHFWGDCAKEIINLRKLWFQESSKIFQKHKTTTTTKMKIINLPLRSTVILTFWHQSFTFKF